MAKEVAKKKGLFKRIRHKYRMVVLNEHTFEERFSMRLSRLNVIAVLGLVFIIAIALTVAVIAYTPVKQMFDGFGNTDYRIQSENTALALDTARVTMAQQKAYLDTLSAILDGRIGNSVLSEDVPAPVLYDTLDLSNSPKDSAFRKGLESEDQYSLSFGGDKPVRKNDMTGVFFFTPLHGIVLSSFDMKKEHYGIDVAAEEDKPILATLDGTVIFAGWTVKDGFVIQVQHSHNFVSVYKHNSALLKKVGNHVKAGEAIAIIGNTGETSTGPHMHFELWYNGSPINPETLMVFK